MDGRTEGRNEEGHNNEGGKKGEKNNHQSTNTDVAVKIFEQDESYEQEVEMRRIVGRASAVTETRVESESKDNGNLTTNNSRIEMIDCYEANERKSSPVNCLPHGIFSFEWSD